LDCFSHFGNAWIGNFENQVNIMFNVKNKKITVLGLARSGVAAANVLYELGAKVLVSDVKTKENLKGFMDQLKSHDIQVSAPGDQVHDIENSDLVILSPGIPLNIPAILEAKKNNITVFGEVELAYRLCKAPIIAITGSNGKTTTTSWVGEILKSAWNGPVSVAGNIGFPLCTAVTNIPNEGIVVAELSSFQLETIDTFRPKIAAILNITPNHMDRYPSMDEYANAKLRIFENQTSNDIAVLNKDDGESMNRIGNLNSQTVHFSRKTNVLSGTTVINNAIILRQNDKEYEICKVDDLKIPGRHNLENALAAIAIVAGCGVDPLKIKKPLTTFLGVEHRLEFVRELDGVKYFNDSKATTVTAVQTALESMFSPIILIAGGKDKGSDYRPLKELMINKVKQLILIGQAKEKIKNELNGSCPITEAGTLQEAVQIARKSSQTKDTVLLSPACASYDMFTDFEDRGRVFKKAVHDLV
jgi:UDP-N-acetylmuramoylalanine--D-glutamate ligase